MIRALIAAVVALFIVWSMRVVPSDVVKGDEPVIDLKLQRYEKVLIGVFFVVLLIFWGVALPYRFIKDLHKETTLTEIYKPYLPYLLYMVGVWLGIVLPVFLLVVRAVFVDFRLWRAKRDRLRSGVPSVVSNAARQFEDLMNAFQEYVICLKAIGERYLPVILGVCLILLYEQLTPSSKTVTSLAVEAGKITLWLLLGPALTILVVLVAIGYQNGTKRAHDGLSVLFSSLEGAARNSEVLEKVLKYRSELIWNHSPAAFILTVIKSVSVFVPLLLAVIGYVFSKLAGPEGWVGVFIPKTIVKFLGEIYGQ